MMTFFSWDCLNKATPPAHTLNINTVLLFSFCHFFGKGFWVGNSNTLVLLRLQWRVLISLPSHCVCFPLLLHFTFKHLAAQTLSSKESVSWRNGPTCDTCRGFSIEFLAWMKVIGFIFKFSNFVFCSSPSDLALLSVMLLHVLFC